MLTIAWLGRVVTDPSLKLCFITSSGAVVAALSSGPARFSIGRYCSFLGSSAVWWVGGFFCLPPSEVADHDAIKNLVSPRSHSVVCAAGRLIASGFRGRLAV